MIAGADKVYVFKRIRAAAGELHQVNGTGMGASAMTSGAAAEITARTNVT